MTPPWHQIHFSLEKIVFPWGQNLPPKTVYLSSMSSKDRGTQDTILSKLYRVLTQEINSFKGLLLVQIYLITTLWNGRWCDRPQPSDGPIIILIDCEHFSENFSETVACWLIKLSKKTFIFKFFFNSVKNNLKCPKSHSIIHNISK